MGTVTIEHATPGRVEQSYPLAQLARPGLTLDEWVNGCTRRYGSGAGLLLAVDASDVVRGLCSYRLQRSAAAAREDAACEAKVFAAAHPFGIEPFVSRLLSELKRIALAAGCRVLEFAPQDYYRWVHRAGDDGALTLRPSSRLVA